MVLAKIVLVVRYVDRTFQILAQLRSSTRAGKRLRSVIPSLLTNCARPWRRVAPRILRVFPLPSRSRRVLANRKGRWTGCGDGISKQTFYRWKKVYGGLGVGELRHLRLLKEENRKFKQLVAHVQGCHGLSERRSCQALGVDRSSVRYVSRHADQAPLMLRTAIFRRRGRDRATSGFTSCCAGRNGW